MEEFQTNTYRAISFRTYLEKVFETMALGLFISGVVAFLVNMFFMNIYALLGSSFSMFLLVCVFAEFGLAIYFSAGLSRMSKETAWTCYILYAVLTGLSLGVVIYSYTTASVVFAFVSALVLFVCMAVIGHTTNLDLTKFSTLIMAGLIALIISSLLNSLLFRSAMGDYLISAAGIILFLIIIAYDVQKLKYYYDAGQYDIEMGEKIMVMGAFQLYLDFINIFLRILSIFGNRRRNN